MNSRSLRLLAVLTIVCVSSCLADNVWVVRPDGVGPVKVGMSLSQLNAALHETFSMPDDKDDLKMLLCESYEACRYQLHDWRRTFGAGRHRRGRCIYNGGHSC